MLSRAVGSKERWQDSLHRAQRPYGALRRGHQIHSIFRQKKAPIKGLFRFASRSVLASLNATTRIGTVCAIETTVYPYIIYVKRIFFGLTETRKTILDRLTQALPSRAHDSSQSISNRVGGRCQALVKLSEKSGIEQGMMGKL
ncbi:hypothetical protein D3C84_388430 [compost metagenome]